MNYLGPIVRNAELVDRSRQPPPGWERAVPEGWGYRVVPETGGSEVFMFASYGFANASRERLLSSGHCAAVDDPALFQGMLEAVEARAALAENTRLHLVLREVETDREVRRLDVTGKPPEVVEHIRIGVVAVHGGEGKVRAGIVENVHGRDAATEPSPDPETTAGPRL